MDSACLRHTDIPATSKLFSDFQYHFDRVARFYDGWPGDPHSFERAAASLKYPDDRRAALVAALREQNAGNPSLDRLAQPGTGAIVTGQQVGLFSGPCFTIYKALTAAKLSQHLSARGIPTVPIFWVATEDHDFAEINHLHIFNASYEPVRLEVDAAGADGQRPVGGLKPADYPLDALRREFADFPFGEDVAALVEAAYTPGASLGGAFSQLLRSLLDKWGVLFVDPLAPALRRIAAPLLRDAMDHSADLKQDLLNRNRELVEAGYHAQVHLDPQTSLFFLLDGNRRLSLRRQNGDYASKDRVYSIAELEDRAEQLSPNALLRPVVQDYLLPTLTYVGGPGELAYMAQSQILYQRLLGRMPVMMARSGFTLLEPRAAKLMDRYELRVQSLLQPEWSVREHIAKKLVPDGLVGEFQAIQQRAAQSLDKLQSELLQFDPTLAKALEGSRRKIQHQLAKMEAKTGREALRRDARAEVDTRYLVNLIYPEKHLQERYYSILPFLAKHGFGLLDTIYEQVNLDCPDHRVLVI